MADKLVEILMGKGVDWFCSFVSWVESQRSRVRNVPSDLRNLRDRRSRIDALLHDAYQHRYVDDQHVIRWLRELECLALDGEDILEEFTAWEASTSRKRKWNSLLVGKGFADRIEELDKKYDGIIKDRKHLRFGPREAVLRDETRRDHLALPESSIRDETLFYGREAESYEIVRWLTADDRSTDLPVISIIGVGGVGKTALAKEVLNDGTVKKFFDLRIWVGLSSQECGVVETTRKIIESVEKVGCGLSSFEQLQYRLQWTVSEKRFLLVLDNVWNENLDFWSKLRLPMLKNGVRGCKVLVTSQSEKVSANMQAKHVLRLEGLPFDPCWSMFCNQAFGRGNGCRVLEGNQQLERICGEIVEKCQGLPVLVKSIASIHQNLTDEHIWRSVLEDMPDNEEALRGILPTLRISYDRLPLHLKRCFAFCSIFPVGYVFDKDELIKLWMALGFIKPSGSRKFEYIGAEYFAGLLHRSFFHPLEEKYQIPSMIHVLARSVSIFGYSGENVAQPDRLEMVRYAMLSQCTDRAMSFERLSENSCLRALMLHGEGGLFTEHVLDKLFAKLRNLRVLDLSNSRLEKLPDSAGDLILLRCLKLSGTRIITLPETVGDLFKLETLELSECHQLEKLPDSIGNLCQLRYLGLYNTRIERLPESVSSLHNLTLQYPNGEVARISEQPS